jgi:imidazoleglycerol phosphate synthase cyclase subunit
MVDGVHTGTRRTVRPRLIPVLLLKHGVIVRSQLFKVHQVIGNPMSTVERYSQWNVDELVVLDISPGDDYHDLRRDDLQQRYGGNSVLDVLRSIAEVCFMPLTFGGRIRSIEDIEARLALGADKVTLNTAALIDPGFVEMAARRFGTQCIVASIDARFESEGQWRVYGQGGTLATDRDPADWAREMEARGAGEVFLNSIDRDGSGLGFDTELIRRVVESVNIPVVACGGVGRYDDFAAGILAGRAAAVSAANIFHFYELSYSHAKQACLSAGLPMRPVGVGSKFLRREPDYDRVREDARIAERIRQARESDYVAARSYAARDAIRWCTECVYPSISAAPMEFDDKGVCTGCQMARVKAAIAPSEWVRRRDLLRDLIEKYRCRDGSRHDVVVAVSGGKDSYFQVHTLKKEFGVNPLLVTYDANNWTDTGWRNMIRMREAFGVDHIVVRPSVDTLKKLNRLAFAIMGDMNWHAHVGIMTSPMKMAVQHNIPLVFYGEHGYLDLCGQFSMDDFPEVTYRDRLEHFARGYEWTYFVGREHITSQEMCVWKYPSDSEMLRLDLRGIFLGNFVYWEANEHIGLVTKRYGFEVSQEPFERTYRTMSNLDDMHENGVHDYLKFVKFGYGRCTDHACKDIRAGIITREEGSRRVREMDHIKSRDLKRWLGYVGMTEETFDRVADTFRDPRVWRVDDDRWIKDDMSGTPSAYGLARRRVSSNSE